MVASGGLPCYTSGGSVEEMGGSLARLKQRRLWLAVCLLAGS